MKKFIYLLYILTGLVPFILPNGALDKVYPEVLYLSVCQFLISIFLLFYDKKYKQITQELFKSKGIIILFTFLIWSAVTILSAFNKVEAVIEWFRFYLFFISIFNVAIIYKIINDKRIFFITVISILFIESYYVFIEFLRLYDFSNPPGRNYSFVGFTSNLNVNAYNLLLKTVLVYYIYLVSRRRWQKILLLILIAISTFNIFIISSRSSIIVLIGVQLFYLGLSSLAYLRKTINKNQLKKAVTIFSITILIFFTQSFLYQNSTDFSIENRITTYDLDDPNSSANFRINFYKEAIKGLLDKPFLGYGIGNWKIFSIKYASHRIREYQVPYHAHNDFLHMFAETGIIGGILYFLIYFFPICYLLINLIKKPNSINYPLYLIISLAFLVFIGDSMFNFPRARAINMSNLIYLYSFFIVEIEKDKIINIFKFNSTMMRIILSIILLFTVLLSTLLFISSKQQLILLQDFNFTKYFARDLKEIEKINHKFPTLTHTTISLASAKANYYMYQDSLIKAKELFFLGNKNNPYLGDTDLGLANLYLKEKKLDSAYFFSKKAVEKLPYNQLHVAVFQLILTSLDDKKYLNEAREIFEKVKDDNVETIWENHLLIEIAYTKIDSFNQYQKNLVNQGLKIFPGNKKILIAEKLMNNNKDKIILANEYDQNAIKLFQENDFLNAISEWEKAKLIVANEDAYYLNIAQAYLRLESYNIALEELKKVEDLKIQENDGKLEFLKASAYLGLEKNKNACNYFRISSEKGYVLSQNIYENLNCN